MKNKLISLLIIYTFTIFYLSFLYFFYIFSNNGNVSIFLFLGYAIIIITILTYILSNNSRENNVFFKFRILSENLIKFSLIIAMFLALIIAPIRYAKFILLWERIGPLNFIRAIIFIIGCSFIPGGCIYSIIFSKTNLHEKFQVESFLIKIIIYPLLSFGLIGTIVLILDKIGIVNIEIYTNILLLFILGLFILDLIVQKVRKVDIFKKFYEIKINTSTLIILILSLGIVLISIGVNLGTLYLIHGDSWMGTGFSNYVGTAKTSPEERVTYPVFWGYIMYGISALTGIPNINTNVLLTPFTYLFVIIIYVLIKAILFEFKEKYIILSTMLVIIFSGFYFFDFTAGNVNETSIIFICENNFIYKTYAYYLFFLSIAIFIIISKSSILTRNLNQPKNNFNHLILLSLVAYFFIISFVVYMFPLLIGVIFIILYCLLSKNKKQNLKLMNISIFFIIIFFIIFDIVQNFFLSNSILYLLITFSGNTILISISKVFPNYILLYLLLGFLFIIDLLFYKISIKWDSKSNKILFNNHIKFTKFYTIFLIIFTIFLFIEIIVIFIVNSFFTYKLGDKIIFFYYLDKIYLNLGIIGILGIYLSPLCYKNNKELGIILLSWIIISFLMGSTFIFLNSVQNQTLFLKGIENIYVSRMNLWYGRIWIYSVIPLCIFCSIGLIRFVKLIKEHYKWKNIFNKKLNLNILNIIISILIIYLSLSNLIVAGIRYGNINNRINKDKIKMISWIEENIPFDSKILLYDYDYELYLGIRSTVSYGIKYIDDLFEEKHNQTKQIEEINKIIEDKIEYLILSEEYLSEDSDIVIFIKTYLKPNFYNESLYESGDFLLYYAPYFD